MKSRSGEFLASTVLLYVRAVLVVVRANRGSHRGYLWTDVHTAPWAVSTCPVRKHGSINTAREAATRSGRTNALFVNSDKNKQKEQRGEHAATAINHLMCFIPPTKNAALRHIRLHGSHLE